MVSKFGVSNNFLNISNQDVLEASQSLAQSTSILKVLDPTTITTNLNMISKFSSFLSPSQATPTTVGYLLTSSLQFINAISNNSDFSFNF